MGMFGKGSNGFLDNVFAWPADILWGGKENDPIIGNAYTGNKQKAVVDAMKDAEQQYEAYRPDMAASRVQGLDQVLGLYQPANNYLGYLYGSGAQLPLQQAGMSPMKGSVGGVKK